MRKISTLVCSIAVAACALSAAPFAAPGNQQPSAKPKDLPPSPLEAFAARSTAKVVWSKTVGQLESQEARATITALTIEDNTATPSVMRGLRIDLAHKVANPTCDYKYSAWRIMCERPNAAVYVEEARLEKARDGILRGAAELRHMEFISRYETTAPGQAAFGLIVCGYPFSNRQPDELAVLFTRGIAELKGAPR